MKKFQVIEDNGGGLHLAVFGESGKVEYLHCGYEYTPGNLAECLKALETCDNPAEEWEGNEENPQETYESITSSECGWEIVADNNVVYPEKMGTNARKELIKEVYELKKYEAEIPSRERRTIESGVTFDTDPSPELVKKFDSLESAEEALGEYKGTVKYMHHYYLVTEYRIEYAMYDYNGEWQEGDALGESGLSIEVIDRETYDVIGVFDSLKDAEDAKSDYEGEGWIML